MVRGKMVTTRELTPVNPHRSDLNCGGGHVINEIHVAP